MPDAYEFKRIPDVEVHPIRFSASIDSVGCKKTNSAAMLTIHHGHSTDSQDGKYYNGNVFIALDEWQLVELINVLDKALLAHYKSKQS